jgi:hypothetical protein
MNKTLRSFTVSYLILILASSCNSNSPVKPVVTQKNPIVINNIVSKTTLKGIVEFPDKFQTKATLANIAANTTVSIIEPNANITIASGITNASAEFTINPSPSFNPSSGSTYILEATKRIGDIGNRVMSARTFIQWNNNSWKSVTTPLIKINSRTTALAIIRGLNLTTISIQDLIDKLDVSHIPSIFTPFGSINGQMLDFVSSLVDTILQKESDPISSIALENDSYIIVDPPNIAPTPVPTPTPGISVFAVDVSPVNGSSTSGPIGLEE